MQCCPQTKSPRICNGPYRCPAHHFVGNVKGQYRAAAPAQVWGTTKHTAGAQQADIKCSVSAGGQSCDSGLRVPRSETPRASRNFVVAVDASEDYIQGSWNAVKWTLENLYEEGDVLHLLHVIPCSESRLPIPVTPFAQPHVEPELETQLEQSAHKFITDSFLDLANCYKAKCEIDLVKGGSLDTVGSVICKKSEALKAAMVVLAAHRKGFLEELIKGSVSKHVAKNCRQPTLLLPF